jgi:peptide deformylase
MIFKVIVYRRENINVAIRTMRLEKDEILRKKSREVDIIDDKIQTLIDDMIETMYKYNGVGLSAVQVGVLKRVVVIDIEDGEGVRVFINPKITSTKGEHEVEEGCLSFPNEYAKVVRPKELTVEALDREGKKFKLKAKDLLAQAVAHEIDHLDGIVFIDRMIPGTLEYVDNSQN